MFLRLRNIYSFFLIWFMIYMVYFKAFFLHLKCNFYSNARYYSSVTKNKMSQ